MQDHRSISPSRPGRAAIPAGTAAKVKGTVIVTLMRFLRERGLDPEAAIGRLPAADHGVLRGILLPSGWYSAEMFARFLDACVRIAAPPDEATFIREMGRFSAQLNMGAGGVRRAYIRQDDPHHVLSSIGRIYQTVYSAGARTYQRTGDRSAIVRGHGTRLAHDHCSWVAGWLQRVVELSGGTDVRVDETQCEGSGAQHCEYKLAWR